jgi:hypothetical protein
MRTPPSRGRFLGGSAAVVAAAAFPRTASAQMKSTISLPGTTTVPFFVYGDGTTVFVAAELGSAKYAFVVDERLPESMLANAVVVALKPQRVGTAQQCGLTGNGDTDNDVYVLPELRVGGLTLANGTWVVGPEPRLDSSYVAPERMHATIGGILGQDFYRRVLASIDFNRSTLTLAEPAVFKPPANGNRLPMVLRKGRYPNVRMTIDGVEGDVDIDTADDTFDVSPTFAKRSGIAKRRGAPPAAFKTTVKVGSVNVREQLVNYDSIEPYFGDPQLAGLTGSDFLSLFVLTLDFAGGAVWFQPNR